MKNKKRSILIITLLIIVLCSGSFFLGVISNITVFSGGIISKNDYDNYKEFKKLFDIKGILNKYYDGDIDESSLVEGAIKGMTESLNDPYTVFMNKDEYANFTKQIDGTYAGIGVGIKSNDDKITVTSVFDNSPAQKAGIKKDDVINKINGENVAAKEMQKAVSLMTGEVGKKVVLSVIRGSETLEFNLTTAKIEKTLVTTEMIDNNIGYIRISEFDSGVAKSFKEKLDDLKSKNAKGIIIDLRGNPGGILKEVVSVTSNFVEKGKIITSTIDKYDNKKEETSSGGDYIGIPMTLLVDEGSASASEIFTGVVRDYKIGTIVGQKTYGKGVVQTTIETGDGTALKVTIAKYYTPSGENIHKVGIQPDIAVAYPKELLDKPYDMNTDPQLNKCIEILKDKLK